MWTKLWGAPTAPKGIWKARNNYVFEKKNPKPEEVIKCAKKDVVDYLQVVCRRVQRLPASAARLGRWVASPPSVLKINCDGAFKSPRSLAAFGVIVRDNGGSAQLWRCGRVLLSSALAIEAWALHIACIVAKEQNLQEVIFETDCKNLVDCLNDQKKQWP
ncbi:hypothetical protein RHMOL_Rhmol05G0317200 [Rhododendron molle]|uniref:Uncharacterized protein n=1 Tax=Rhododendron molle TaxID=49168 RepID=A0ACC0NW21_RHOML|nr:hypothetical protein RHMOL_Rhmol05G0317200 [Rhododendron molle]